MLPRKKQGRICYKWAWSCMQQLLPSATPASRKQCPPLQAVQGNRKSTSFEAIKIAVQRAKVLVCSSAHSRSQHRRVPGSCSPRARPLLCALNPSCTPFSFPSLYSPPGNFTLHPRDGAQMQCNHEAAVLEKSSSL